MNSWWFCIIINYQLIKLIAKPYISINCNIKCISTQLEITLVQLRPCYRKIKQTKICQELEYMSGFHEVITLNANDPSRNMDSIVE